MQKHEASITARINKWFAPTIATSSPWEVKHTRGSGTFALRELKEHQRNYLFAATTPTGFTYKIPDIGPSFPPCDVIHYKNTPAYVIIAFPAIIVAIDIRKLLDYFEEKEGRTMTQAEGIALSDFKIARGKLPH